MRVMYERPYSHRTTHILNVELKPRRLDARGELAQLEAPRRLDEEACRARLEVGGGVEHARRALQRARDGELARLTSHALDFELETDGARRSAARAPSSPRRAGSREGR